MGDSQMAMLSYNLFGRLWGDNGLSLETVELMFKDFQEKGLIRFKVGEDKKVDIEASQGFEAYLEQVLSKINKDRK